MKLNITESIREVLMDRKPVSLYGLGTLCLKQVASDYGKNRKSLLPPTMEMEFSETSSTNAHLTQWLIAKYGLTKNKAEQAIKIFSEHVLNALLNTGSVNLPGVAVFERNKENEISCNPDQGILNAFYKGFPEVTLSIPVTAEDQSELEALPIKADDPAETLQELKDDDIANVEEKSGEETDDAVQDEQGEEQIVKTLHEQLSELDQEIKLDVQGDESKEVFDLKSKEETSKVEDELKAFEQMIRQAEIEHEEKKSRKISHIWGYLLIAFSIILAIVLLVDACKHLGNKMADDHQEKTVDVSLAEAGDPEAEAMLSGVTDVLPQDNCIIITGVFSSSRNVDIMTQKILEKSYEVYTETNGSYTRVGLQFQCADVNLQEFIQRIRTEISPKAWYLNPELYVAYH